MESYVRIGGGVWKSYVPLHGGRRGKNCQNHPYVIYKWLLTNYIYPLKFVEPMPRALLQMKACLCATELIVIVDLAWWTFCAAGLFDRICTKTIDTKISRGYGRTSIPQTDWIQRKLFYNGIKTVTALVHRITRSVLYIVLLLDLVHQ